MRKSGKKKKVNYIPAGSSGMTVEVFAVRAEMWEVKEPGFFLSIFLPKTKKEIIAAWDGVQLQPAEAETLAGLRRPRTGEVCVNPGGNRGFHNHGGRAGQSICHCGGDWSSVQLAESVHGDGQCPLALCTLELPEDPD